jgi:hypothetical protein
MRPVLANQTPDLRSHRLVRAVKALGAEEKKQPCSLLSRLCQVFRMELLLLAAPLWVCNLHWIPGAQEG